MTHIKRFSMPATWPMSRKEHKFAISPSPGPHTRKDSIPLRVVLRDVLGYADNAKEARSILSQGKVLVDKRPRRDSGFPVGLMDVIEIPDTKDFFRVVAGAKGLELEKIRDSDASWKVCKIRGKTTIRGGIQQLNLHDGRNITVKKDTYNVGDSIMVSIPEQKILKHHKLEKGAYGFITAGRNMGIWGRIKEIEEKKHMLEKSTVIMEVDKKDIKTLREYIFIAERAATPKPEKKPSEGKDEKSSPGKTKEDK